MSQEEVNIDGTNTQNEDVEGVERDAEILDFVELVNCISEYYGSGTTEDGDEWKAGQNKGDINTIPTKIDKLVEKAFSFQLKRFTK